MPVECTLPSAATDPNELRDAAKVAKLFLNDTRSIYGAFKKMEDTFPGLHPESIRRAVSLAKSSYEMEAKAAGLKVYKTPAARTQEQRLAQYKAYKQTAINRVEEKLRSRDISEPVRTHTVLDERALRLQDEYVRARGQWDALRKEYELGQRPVLKKAVDYLVELARQVKLTGIVTAGKIALYTPYKLAETAAGDIASGIGSIVPGMRGVMLRAPTEGIPSMAAYGKLGKGFAQGIRDIPSVFRGKIPPNEIAEAGRGARISKGLVESPARTHAAIKQPLRQGIAAMSLEKAVRAAIRRGEDPSLYNVMRAERMRAVEAGNRGILLQNNLITTVYSRLLGVLEREGGAPGYIASKTMQTLLPIIRIGTNIPIEAARMAHGIPTAFVRRLVVEMNGGLKKASPEQLDLIARNFKTGSIGVALGLTGYLLRNQFSGLYIHGNKYEEDRIFGLTGIPAKLIGHSPGMLFMRAVATAGKLIDQGASTPEAGFKAAYALLHEVPFLNLAQRIDDLVTAKNLGKAATKFVGQQASGLVPAFVREIAQLQDSNVRRKPENISDYVKASVPGLRQQVPTAQTKIPSRERQLQGPRIKRERQ